ncbi:YL1 nuclear protein, putative [Plasmodium sp. gorilla clade G2]|uniref:YL1 nuclear protein, putative n=1 Tax=Plasmodium sp. gorilla clade G2 TaxID=880535 RepID=UPI000D2088D8|nr:YL1 nuclear protein, putative [Plasmodium sp. gorilla clade G2]SOV19772.1 YL1 nuclear protein, putative [Plasmodium sp. gorilla clade G2]
MTKKRGKGGKSISFVLENETNNISYDKINEEQDETEEESEMNVEESSENEFLQNVSEENESGDNQTGENDSEEEDSEEDEDYELKNYGIALELPQRKNRGKNMKKLIGEDLEKDEQFWNDSIWEEEEIDEEYVNSEGEDEYIDITDSDFDDDEDIDEDEEDEVEEDEQNKHGAGRRPIEYEERQNNKKKSFAYIEKLKKEKQNKIMKYHLMKQKQNELKKNKELIPNNLKKSEEDVTEEQKEQVIKTKEQLKEERRLKKKKKLEQAYLYLNRSTRDTTRRKTEYMEKVFEMRKIKKENRFKKFGARRREKKSMQREMTREERLEEAKITEQYNIQSLLQLQAWEEEKKKYVENKKVMHYKPQNVFISFKYSKDKTIPTNEKLTYPQDLYDYYTYNENTTINNDIMNQVKKEINVNIINNNQTVKVEHELYNNHKENINNQKKNSTLSMNIHPQIILDNKEHQSNYDEKEILSNQNSNDNTKDEKKDELILNPMNLENLDQCEDLNIQYLNQIDDINFDNLNKNKNNIINSTSNNQNIYDENKNNSNVLNQEINRKTTLTIPDYEEKQYYIVTNENELNIYSNFNDQKDEINEFKNKKQKKQKICAITNLEGKYFDPLTQQYYNNAQAFKTLRLYYHQISYNNLNKDICLTVKHFKNKLTEIEQYINSNNNYNTSNDMPCNNNVKH